MYSSVPDPGASLRGPRDRTVWAACGPPPGKGNRTWISPQPRDPGTNSARAASPPLPPTGRCRRRPGDAPRRNGLTAPDPATPRSCRIRFARVVRSHARLPRRRWSGAPESATPCRSRRPHRPVRPVRPKPRTASRRRVRQRVMPSGVGADPRAVDVNVTSRMPRRRSRSRLTAPNPRPVSAGVAGVVVRRRSSRTATSSSSGVGASARESPSVVTSCASRSATA